MPEIIFTFIAVACIVWGVWSVRKHRKAGDKAALDEAWREVLNDPHYVRRLDHEERKRLERKRAVDEARAHHREA